MNTINYAMSKAYQNNLIKQAEGEHLMKSAKQSQKKSSNLRQITRRVSKSQKQAAWGVEFETL